MNFGVVVQDFGLPIARLQTDAHYAGQWRDLVAELDPIRYPLVCEAEETLATVASTEQFHWGLHRLVHGPDR